MGSPGFGGQRVSWKNRASMSIDLPDTHGGVYGQVGFVKMGSKQNCL